MQTNEILSMMDADFLHKIYRFAYRRCSSSFEAEDLSSDIVLAVVSAVRRQSEIENFYAFVWTVARRVYADFCRKRSGEAVSISMENCDFPLVSEANEIDALLEKTADEEQFRRILSEIAFLSKAYRDVMVMYYVEERKVKEIAERLGISETTVKQRLFYARNTVKKEVENMNKRNLCLQPVKLEIFGTGSPCGNDPREKAESAFSQNLVYLCKDKPKTAKELSEELCMPMYYIENELGIQCRGENGEYGLLRKLENGKYITNILLADQSEFEEASKIFERSLPEIISALKNTVEKNKEKILGFPYLSRQDDIRFILWSMISDTEWDFKFRVKNAIEKKYFGDIEPVYRMFSCAGIAFDAEKTPEPNFYGSNGITSKALCGFNSVYIVNIGGKYMDTHFGCGHNISNDHTILMLLRSIGGLSVKDLTERERDIAAKAIECGYIRKNGDSLEPNIIAFDNGKDAQDFYDLASAPNEELEEVIDKTAQELALFMRKHIPGHLMGDYKYYTDLIAGVRFRSQMIDACIKEGLLYIPEKRLGAEGMLMVVEK